MKFKVMGSTFQNGERRTICYGEYDNYTEAHEYKEWLDDSDNWKGKLQDKPYLLYVEESRTEGEQYFDKAMGPDEQNDY